MWARDPDGGGVRSSRPSLAPSGSLHDRDRARLPVGLRVLHRVHRRLPDLEPVKPGIDPRPFLVAAFFGLLLWAALLGVVYLVYVALP